MRPSIAAAVGTLAAAVLPRVMAGMPDKMYGVNLGGWLLIEPWIIPQEWVDMGGDWNCTDCATCIGSEFSLVEAYPDTADEKFEKHWSTWFTQSDVDALSEVGINTIRIPLGYWIVERLVNRKTEFFPRGGISHLKRGAKMLKDAGMNVILDHHALPGVQTSDQAFAGQCTKDVEFYTPYNYQRALVWTAVMTAVSHLDPDFSAVFAIQAVNEPIMDATLTPGYGEFQKQFVQTLRAMEYILGIGSPEFDLDIDVDLSASASNVTATISATIGGLSVLDLNVKTAILSSIPILVELSEKLDFRLDFLHSKTREPLVANFMDVSWQYNNPANPADAAIGPMGYDNHLYYNFGGVTDQNEKAYMIHICNLQRLQNDAAKGNSPLWFGEWAISTGFNATDEFLYKWADAQKHTYSQGQGWLFWNFKIEISELAGDQAREWSYLEGVRRGYFTKDPAALHDPDVCAPYVGKTYTSTTAVVASSTTSTSASATDSTVSASTTAASSSVTEVTTVSSSGAASTTTPAATSSDSGSITATSTTAVTSVSSSSVAVSTTTVTASAMLSLA
ncbi:glycoside hydrolase [Lentinus tigrinus ALCF2SS1-7]|uniref:Glycoside hydrolase n=1 Tax=Lentinus tigrinus ALCF2SS1-6 TaxID=1328759 RepID=A0A5C2S5M1_9APHY|nr:glycoside hydrolase [Lentinus tigrinus ALCF2SS1-6]RPD73355.1 glycoside hydrolase [Lentinus tigrinus ALCF2SS1-7]